MSIDWNATGLRWSGLTPSRFAMSPLVVRSSLETEFEPPRHREHRGEGQQFIGDLVLPGGPPLSRASYLCQRFSLWPLCLCGSIPTDELRPSDLESSATFQRG